MMRVDKMCERSRMSGRRNGGRTCNEAPDARASRARAKDKESLASSFLAVLFLSVPKP